MVLDYTKSALRLDDADALVDRSVQVKNIKLDDREFAIIINLHENRVVIIEYDDAEEHEENGGIIKTLHQKWLYHERELYNKDDVYERPHRG